MSNYIIQSPIENKSKIEGYMHKNSIAFNKKTVDETIFYFAMMCDHQVAAIKKEFSNIALYDTDVSEDEVMEAESPFPYLEPTRPDELEPNTWKMALGVLVALALVAVSWLVFL